MFENASNILILILIFICLLSVISATIFQSKRKKKYKEVTELLKDRDMEIFQIKDSLSEDDIKRVDPSIDINKLMMELYDIYINFENKIKTLDSNFNDILVGNIEKIYVNKINNLKKQECKEVRDNIELIGYSITSFNCDKLKFRININSFKYKQSSEKILSGSNTEKVEEVLILTFEKIDSKWLISGIEPIYEKKLSN